MCNINSRRRKIWRGKVPLLLCYNLVHKAIEVLYLFSLNTELKRRNSSWILLCVWQTEVYTFSYTSIISLGFSPLDFQLISSEKNMYIIVRNEVTLDIFYLKEWRILLIPFPKDLNHAKPSERTSTRRKRKHKLFKFCLFNLLTLIFWLFI